jgi:hypothetical protein
LIQTETVAEMLALLPMAPAPTALDTIQLVPTPQMPATSSTQESTVIVMAAATWVLQNTAQAATTHQPHTPLVLTALMS